MHADRSKPILPPVLLSCAPFASRSRTTDYHVYYLGDQSKIGGYIDLGHKFAEALLEIDVP
jgi:hypothetical protein